jgi:hypothetical protein
MPNAYKESLAELFITSAFSKRINFAIYRFVELNRENKKNFIKVKIMWRDVREAEGARLEIVCTLNPYRGFKSHSLRHLGHLKVPAFVGCLAAARERPFAAGGCEPREVRKEATVSIFPGCRR